MSMRTTTSAVAARSGAFYDLVAKTTQTTQLYLGGAAPETIRANGTCSLSSSVTYIDASASGTSFSVILPVPTMALTQSANDVGLIKVFVMTTTPSGPGIDVTIFPSAPMASQDVVLNDANQVALYMWDGLGWNVISNTGSGTAGIPTLNQVLTAGNTTGPNAIFGDIYALAIDSTNPFTGGTMGLLAIPGQEATGASNGIAMLIECQDAVGSGNGAMVKMQAGENTAGTGQGGPVEIHAGDSAANHGGLVMIGGGASASAGNGGQINMAGGDAVDGFGGSVTIVGGTTATTAGFGGGSISLTGGSHTGTGLGGGNGGSINMLAGAGYGDGVFEYDGGHVTFKGGDARNSPLGIPGKVVMLVGANTTMPARTVGRSATCGIDGIVSSGSTASHFTVSQNPVNAPSITPPVAGVLANLFCTDTSGTINIAAGSAPTATLAYYEPWRSSTGGPVVCVSASSSTGGIGACLRGTTDSGFTFELIPAAAPAVDVTLHYIVIGRTHGG
jgi:hypothetical protein